MFFSSGGEKSFLLFQELEELARIHENSLLCGAVQPRANELR